MAGKAGKMLVASLAGCCKFTVIHNFENVKPSNDFDEHATPQEHFESFINDIDIDYYDAQGFIFTDSVDEGSVAGDKTRGQMLAEWIVKQGLGDVQSIELQDGNVTLYVWQPNADAVDDYRAYLDNRPDASEAKVKPAKEVKARKVAKPVYVGKQNSW